KLRLFETFTKLWQEKKPTVVFVTHDLDEALTVAHRVIVLDEGKIVKELQVTGNKSEKEELLEVLLRG
ncbi:MAG: sulfonate ABC transporter ATP-binding protein, partial [Clostridia bacterium]|nr:sulfonate ABC transporter ATP-binding protein [Clostridia bacterium]